MPTFEPSGHDQARKCNTAPSHFNQEIFFANDGIQTQEPFVINAWVALHNSYGKKILYDKGHWISKNQILDL